MLQNYSAFNFPPSGIRYPCFYHDYVERRGVTSSMIGGWKFIEKEHLENE